jgi:hypothetical protein
MYQPKTGARCSCRRGIERSNCPNCEGTGMVIDFRAIRERSSRSAGANNIAVPAMINPSAEDMANMESSERNRGKR